MRSRSAMGKPSSIWKAQVRYRGLAPMHATSLAVPHTLSSPTSPPGKNAGETMKPSVDRARRPAGTASTAASSSVRSGLARCRLKMPSMSSEVCLPPAPCAKVTMSFTSDVPPLLALRSRAVLKPRVPGPRQGRPRTGRRPSRRPRSRPCRRPRDVRACRPCRRPGMLVACMRPAAPRRNDRRGSPDHRCGAGRTSRVRHSPHRARAGAGPSPRSCRCRATRRRAAGAPSGRTTRG